MTTARFFFGASLWALLIVDMCCGPVKKGFNPGSGSNQEVLSSQRSPGLLPEGAYPGGPELVLSAASGSSSRPIQYSGSAARGGPAGPAQSGAGFQSGSKEWLIPPPIFGDEKTLGVASSSNAYGILPFPPDYQAGELAHYERNLETGKYDSETEERGFLPPPRSEPVYAYMAPPLAQSLEGYVSPPLPDSGPAGRWNVYPYYDYMLLTGQYPPGTYTHFSGGSEKGRDNFQEVHYVREYLPNPVPSQPINTRKFESPEAPKAPAYGGSTRGGPALGPIYLGIPARQPSLPARGYGSNSNAVKPG